MKVDLEERPQELVRKPSHRLRTLRGGEPWGGLQGEWVRSGRKNHWARWQGTRAIRNLICLPSA